MIDDPTTDAQMADGPRTDEAGEPTPDSPTGEDPSPGGGAPRTPARWPALLGRFWLHAAALLVLLAALVPVFDTHGPAFLDEGLYSAQVDFLSEGSWAGDRPAPDVDPEGDHPALNGALVRGDEMIPYARRPAYPLLLVPFHELLGDAGLLVASLLGTWVAAVASAHLAGRIRAELAVPTLWLVGLVSPLVFDAYLVIGHSIAAGLGASGLLALSKALDERRTVWLAGALPAFAVLVLVRSEGTILVAAAGAAAAAMALRARPWRVDVHQLVCAGAVLLTGAGAFVLDGRLARRFSDGLQTSTGSVVSDRDPLNVAWISLLRPANFFQSDAQLAVVVSVVVVAAALVALRFLTDRPLAPLAVLGAGAVLMVGAHFQDPLLLMTGLLATFPVLLAVVFLTTGDLRNPAVTRLAVTATLGAIAIACTVYGEGGAAEWGGRFFHVLIPVFAPLVALGLSGAARRLEPSEARFFVGAVAVFSLALSAYALRVNEDYRSRSSPLVEGTMRFTREQSISDDPVVLITTVVPPSWGRAFWRPVVDGADVLTVPANGTVEMVERALDAGRQDIVLLADTTPNVLEQVLSEPFEELGVRVRRVQPAGTFTLVHVTPR